MKEVEIYQKLKQLRKERGLTLNNLAEKMGADYQQISRIERGKSRLTIDVLMKMADALETPVSDIMKIRPEEETAIIIQNRKDEGSFVQEMLALVLEKIDTLFQEAKVQVSPQTKAMLTSKIYTQALMKYQETQNTLATEELIDYSVNLVKTMI